MVSQPNIQKSKEKGSIYMDFGNVFKKSFSKAFSKEGFKLSLLTWLVTGLILLTVFTTGYTQPESSPVSFWVALLVVPISLIAAITIWIGSIRVLHQESFDWKYFTEDLASTFFRTIGAYILAGLAMMIGFFLLFIPGVIAYTALYITVPLVVLEGKQIIESLKTSWSRTKGSRFAILGLGIVLWSITSVALAPFQIGAVLLGAFTNPVIYGFAVFIASYVGVYTQLLTTAASVAVYEDISKD